ncbi:universal stress protein [Curtobacterium ammoniigenes]|uniref:universal stress protein n=1 Tax=Curtobacterium ammoniigenes TaxID=395387 RepID=UPI000A96BE40|nr:universal stress protein [Curtobacterium ammoniigenes]
MTTFDVGIDDTAAAWNALEWVDEVVDPAHDAVRLLTIDGMSGEDLEWAEERLQAAKQRLLHHHPGLHVVRAVIEGPTVRQLVEDSRTRDVLVLGGRQTHRFAAAISGRVAERVVAQSAAPVVVIPEGWMRSAEGPVVVGVDSGSAGRALEVAASFAERLGRRLVLLRAWDLPFAQTPYGMILTDDDPNFWREGADLELAAAQRAVHRRHAALTIERQSRRGSAADALIAVQNPALIVLGRRHRSAAEAFLTGSVGERLMHHGTAPVCVVGDVAAPAPATRSDSTVSSGVAAKAS